MDLLIVNLYSYRKIVVNHTKNPKSECFMIRIRKSAMPVDSVSSARYTRIRSIYWAKVLSMYSSTKTKFIKVILAKSSESIHVAKGLF